MTNELIRALDLISGTLIEEIKRLEAKIKQLEGNFSHFHVDNEINELCALCGLAVINAVHLRSR